MKYTPKQMQLLERLLRYSERYQISIQFWPTQVAVYIMKDEVDLTSFGGTFDEAIQMALDYFKKLKVKPDGSVRG